MINIASIYQFTLLEKLSQKYKDGLQEVVKNMRHYLDEESCDYTVFKKVLWEYELICFEIHEVGKIYLYHRTKRQESIFYYPSFYSDIYVENRYLESEQETKKIIFFLSNIFECFDEFEEKNLMIQFHKDIETTINNKKKYTLRYDFMNINSLSEIFNEKQISDHITKFIEKNHIISNMSTIKYNYPETYRMLLFFLYNIFSLQKSYISTNNELAEIQKFEETNWENSHISLSQERLKLNQKSLEKTLILYKQNFENFMEILVKN